MKVEDAKKVLEENGIDVLDVKRFTDVTYLTVARCHLKEASEMVNCDEVKVRSRAAL